MEKCKLVWYGDTYWWYGHEGCRGGVGDCLVICQSGSEGGSLGQAIICSFVKRLEVFEFGFQ